MKSAIRNSCKSLFLIALIPILFKFFETDPSERSNWMAYVGEFRFVIFFFLQQIVLFFTSNSIFNVLKEFDINEEKKNKVVSLVFRSHVFIFLIYVFLDFSMHFIKKI